MKKLNNNYLKYSGIGLQLISIVVGGTYAGFWMDRYLHHQKPVFSVLMGFISVVFGIYLMVKELLKN